jgi:hypothetical protein
MYSINAGSRSEKRSVSFAANRAMAMKNRHIQAVDLVGNGSAQATALHRLSPLNLRELSLIFLSGKGYYSLSPLGAFLQELSEDGLQDAAVPQVLNLDRRVDAGLDLKLLRLAAVTRGFYPELRSGF